MAVLDNTHVVVWGWPFCTRTTYKLIDLYEKLPWLVSALQRRTPLFRSGYDLPRLEASIPSRVKHLDLGCGFIGIVDANKRVFLWGDNYAGQLGQGDDIHRDHPTLLKTITSESVKQISLGFQHGLVLTESGTVYGVGKNDRYQLGQAKKLRD